MSYYQTIKPVRDAWRAEFERCMVCRNVRPLEVHEIEKRSSAPRSWGRRCNYLAVCMDCHMNIEGHPKRWTHAVQLAIKKARDPKHYSLRDWLKIKPRPDTYVTEDEVAKFFHGGAK